MSTSTPRIAASSSALITRRRQEIGVITLTDRAQRWLENDRLYLLDVLIGTRSDGPGDDRSGAAWEETICRAKPFAVRNRPVLGEEFVQVA